MNSKKTKIAVIIIIVACVLAACVVAVGVAVHIFTAQKTVSIEAEGTIDVTDLADTSDQETLQANYEVDMSIYDSESAFTLDFDLEAGTFVAAMDGETMAEGDYTLEGNLLTVMSYDEDTGEVSQSNHYLVDGDYLLMEGSVYYGEIPDGDTFAAKVERSSESTSQLLTYEFFEDGTYTCTELNTDGEETVIEGTYTRNGNFIERTLSGVDVIPFYVYEGHLIVSYYTACEETEE